MPRFLLTLQVHVEVACDNYLLADIIALQGVQIRRELTPTDRGIPLVSVVANEELRPVVIDGED